MRFALIQMGKQNNYFVGLYRDAFVMLLLKTSWNKKPDGVSLGKIENAELWTDPTLLMQVQADTAYTFVSVLPVNVNEVLKERMSGLFEAILKNGWEDKVAVAEERVCEVCGGIFTPKHADQKFCSTLCYNRAHNRRHNEKRETRKRKNGFMEYFSIYDVYKRDKGICWICGEKCDFEDYMGELGKPGFRPGETYPSIDHVQPLSRGGKHTLSNVRLACHKCNNERANHYDPLKDQPKVKKKIIVHNSNQGFDAEALWGTKPTTIDEMKKNVTEFLKSEV